MNCPRITSWSALLLGAVLALPLASSWAVPVYTPSPAQAQSSHPDCMNSAAQPLPPHSGRRRRQASLDHLYSPCHLQDAESDRHSRINDGEPDQQDEDSKPLDDAARLTLSQQEQPGPHGLMVKEGVAADQTRLSRHADFSAPVPEPEHYAMLLIGLGVVAAALRQRKAPA